MHASQTQNRAAMLAWEVPLHENVRPVVEREPGISRFPGAQLRT